MKYLMGFLILLMFPQAALSHTNETGIVSFDDYLKNFDDRERRNMKIGIPQLIELYERNEVQILDIRTPEEHNAYHLPFMKHIPMNELPERLNELDKNKIVVTVCSIYVRAAIVRTYLILNGFKSRYLRDGMLGLAKYLKTDSNKVFHQKQVSR